MCCTQFEVSRPDDPAGWFRGIVPISGLPIQVYVSYTLYIAPTTENERSTTHAARASPSFSKRPVFSDVLVNARERGEPVATAPGAKRVTRAEGATRNRAENAGCASRKRAKRAGVAVGAEGEADATGDNEVWCGKLLLLFRLKLPKNSLRGPSAENDATTTGQFVYLPCAFVRWYEHLPQMVDASGCPYYRWEANPKQARVSVVFASLIREVVQMLPVPKNQNPANMKDVQLYRRNIWLRKS